MTISRAHRARLLAMAAVPALVLAACGDSAGGGSGDVEAGQPDGFDASPAYLAQVVESSRSQPYRFDGSMSMGGLVGGEMRGVRDVPMVSGSFDGNRTYQRVDMEPLLEAVADEAGEELPIDLDQVDLSMEIVADGRTVYLRAPDYDAIVEPRPGPMDGDTVTEKTAPPLIEVLSDLGDSWGRVDLDALGEEILPGEVTSALNSGRNTDPAFLLGMVAGASGAEELDQEEVDGEPMVGVAADVNLVEMLEAQGVDPDEVLAQIESQPGAPPDIREVLQNFTVPMEVRIDADGHVRRLVQDMGRAMAELAHEVGEEPSEGGMPNMVLTVDFHDHGNRSIEVAVPDPAQTVDLTDTFRAMQAVLAD